MAQCQETRSSARKFTKERTAACCLVAIFRKALEIFRGKVATSGGTAMFARIGVMRALNRHVERVFNSDRKDHHWGRRKLKRDQ